MAQKLYCDTCGGEIKGQELPAKFIIIKRQAVLLAGKTQTQPQAISIDLCENCGDKINNNIENLKRKNNYYG